MIWPEYTEALYQDQRRYMLFTSIDFKPMRHKAEPPLLVSEPGLG